MVDRTLLFRCFTCATSQLALVYAIIATVSTWFTVDVRRAEPLMTLNQSIHVEAWLWDIRVCNATVLPGYGREWSSCKNGAFSDIFLILDLMEMDSDNKNTWADSLALFQTLRFTSVIGCALLLIGIIATATTYCRSKFDNLKIVMCGVWYLMTSLIQVINFVCAVEVVRPLSKTVRASSHCEQQTYLPASGNGVCHMNLTIVTRAIAFLGISGFLSLLLCVLYIVACCKRRRRATLLADTGLPNDLAEDGPVVSCNDDHEDLQRFLNKARLCDSSFPGECDNSALDTGDDADEGGYGGGCDNGDNGGNDGDTRGDDGRDNDACGRDDGGGAREADDDIHKHANQIDHRNDAPYEVSSCNDLIALD